MTYTLVVSALVFVMLNWRSRRGLWWTVSAYSCQPLV